jgi:hypothetical protein
MVFSAAFLAATAAARRRGVARAVRAARAGARAPRRLPRRLLLPAPAGVLRARVRRPWRRVGGAGAEHGVVQIPQIALVLLLLLVGGGILLFGRLG